MFFKRNDFIDLTNKSMKKKQIPILIYDRQWKQLFSSNMNKTMENLSKELEKLIKEEKELQKRLKGYQHRKRILMNKIIHLSARINIKGEQVDAVGLDNARGEIVAINEEIDKIREELEMYLRKIRHVNIELLEETAKIAYLEINKAEIRIEFVDHQISLLREKLGQHWDEKEALEKNIQILYSLLHSTIGSEEIEKLDEKFFKIEDEN